MKEEESKCQKVYCVCALGSRDRSISIWQTKASRPLCVLHDLFDNPIVDLSWSKKPKPALLACSMDGTIAYVEFDYTEIGYPLTKQETVSSAKTIQEKLKTNIYFILFYLLKGRVFHE